MAGLKKNEVVVTDERLIMFSGIIDRDLREVPFEHITNVSATNDMVQHLLTQIDRCRSKKSASERPRNFAPTTSFDPAAELRKLHELVIEGVISDEEFRVAKRHVLQKI